MITWHSRFFIGCQPSQPIAGSERPKEICKGSTTAQALASLLPNCPLVVSRLVGHSLLLCVHPENPMLIWKTLRVFWDQLAVDQHAKIMLLTKKNNKQSGPSCPYNHIECHANNLGHVIENISDWSQIRDGKAARDETSKRRGRFTSWDSPTYCLFRNAQPKRSWHVSLRLWRLNLACYLNLSMSCCDRHE